MKRSIETALAGGLILIALGLSLVYILDGANHFDGDEAVVGLMARHILEGRVPVYFYGQGYMGSLEALTAAGWFALLGPSIAALKLAPLAFYLLFLILQYRLVRKYGGAGTALLTLAVTVVFSPTIILWSTKARGGFTAVLFWGTLAYWLAFRLIDGIEAGKFRWRDGFLLGAAAGLGFWTCGMVAYYYFPIVLYFLLRGSGEAKNLLKAGRRLWAEGKPRRVGWSPKVRWAIGAVFIILAVYLLFSLGALILGEIDLSLPGLRVRSRDGLRDLTRAGGLFLVSLAALLRLGGAKIDYRSLHRRFAGRYPHLAAGAGALIVYILFSETAAGLFRATPEYEYGSHQTVAAVKSLSQAGRNLALVFRRLLPSVTGISRVSFKFDPGNTPLLRLSSRLNQATLIAAIALTAFSLLSAVIVRSRRAILIRGKRLELFFFLSALGCLLALSLTSQIQDTTSYRYLIPVVSWLPYFLARLIGRAGRLWKPAASLLALAVLGGHIGQLAPEILRPQLFSPDPNVRPIIKTLAEAGANRVRANYWLSYPINFLTGEEIIAAPYQSQDRYPPYTRQVENAGEVAYVFIGTRLSRELELERIHQAGRVVSRIVKLRWGYLVLTRREETSK